MTTDDTRNTADVETDPILDRLKVIGKQLEGASERIKSLLREIDSETQYIGDLNYNIRTYLNDMTVETASRPGPAEVLLAPACSTGRGATAERES